MPLERFAAAVGHGNVTGPYPTKHQPRYQLHYTGSTAEAVWELLEPYVTEPTREKYQRAKEEYQPVAA